MHLKLSTLATERIQIKMSLPHRIINELLRQFYYRSLVHFQSKFGQWTNLKLACKMPEIMEAYNIMMSVK